MHKNIERQTAEGSKEIYSDCSASSRLHVDPDCLVASTRQKKAPPPRYPHYITPASHRIPTARPHGLLASFLSKCSDCRAVRPRSHPCSTRSSRSVSYCARARRGGAPNLACRGTIALPISLRLCAYVGERAHRVAEGGKARGHIESLRAGRREGTSSR